MMAKLLVKLLGIPSVRVGREDIAFPYKKAESLFYYMVVCKKAGRSDLTGLLWTDTDEALALKNLRHAIFTIKKALGQDIFESGSRSVLKLREDLELDCDVYSLLEKRNPDCYHGAFLKGFHVGRAAYFEEWVETQRTLYQNKYLSLISSLKLQAQESGNELLVQKYGRRIRDIDPLDEHNIYDLMCSYAATQEYAKSTEIFQHFSHALLEEFGIKPLKRTTDLYYGILHQWNDMTEYQEEGKRKQIVIGKKAAIRCILSAVKQEESYGALILGEAGVGKSFLLERLTEELHSSGESEISVKLNCFSSEREIPFSSWNIVMRRLLAEAEKKRLRSLRQEGEQLSKFEGRYGESVIEILEALTESVSVQLVFEDIQWMDQRSLELLELALRRVPRRLRILATMRENQEPELCRFLQTVQKDRVMEVVPLFRFSQEETRIFLSSLLRGTQSHRLEEDVYFASRGNALLIQQIANSFLESGDLKQEEIKLEDIIASRLRRLEKREKEVLELIASFLNWASVGALSEILEWDLLEVIQLCHHLCQIFFLQESRKREELCFRIAHDSIKRVLIKELPLSKYRIHQLQIARMLEQQQSISGAGEYDALIYYFGEGGDKLHSLYYQSRALLHLMGLEFTLFPSAINRDLPEEGQVMNDTAFLRYLEKLERDILQLGESRRNQELIRKTRLCFYYVKGRYHIYRGAYEEGLISLTIAEKLAEMLHDSGFQIRIVFQYIFYGIQICDISVMEKYCGILRTLITEEDSEECGDYYRLFGFMALEKGEFSAAKSALFRSVRIFQNKQKRREGEFRTKIAGAYNYLGEVLRQSGELDRAVKYYNIALDQKVHSTGTAGSAIILTNKGQALFQKGKEELAEKIFCHAEDVQKRSREYSGLPILLSYRSLYLLREGNIQMSAARMKRAMEISRMIRSPWWLGFCLYMGWRIRKEYALPLPSEWTGLFPEDAGEHLRKARELLKNSPYTLEKRILEQEIQINQCFLK